MKVELREYNDNWQSIKNATMNTIGKNIGAYPSSRWKRRLLLSEHSPIRKLKISWRWLNLPYWVSTHFVRHKVGIEHFCSTQRSDRTNVDRNNAPQSSPVTHECEANAQAIINISRKRLCNRASPETREAWMAFLDEVVAPIEPELRSVCVPECVYRGFCPEMFPCGYSETEEYEKAVLAYREGQYISVFSNR